jgi:asparagine synthase (glutamine-hydrolysing)
MNRGLLERARQDGATAMLWGLGGDEVTSSGDAYLEDFIRLRRWRAAAAALRDRCTLAGWPSFATGLRACARQGVPAPVARVLRIPRAWRRRASSPPAWIDPAFLRRAGLADAPVEPPRRFAAETQQSIWSGLVAGRAMAYGLPGLDVMADRFSMEFRYPFFDRRLVEFLLRLRTRSVEIFAGKLLLREALRGILPELVRTRLSKAGFEPQIDLEFTRRCDKLRALVDESALVRCIYLQANGCECLSGAHACANLSKYRGAIVRFVRSELWLRAFQDRRRILNEQHQAAGVCRKETVLDPPFDRSR